MVTSSKPYHHDLTWNWSQKKKFTLFMLSEMPNVCIINFLKLFRLRLRTLTAATGGMSPSKSGSLGSDLSLSLSFDGERNAFLTALNQFPFLPIFPALQNITKVVKYDTQKYALQKRSLRFELSQLHMSAAVISHLCSWTIVQNSKLVKMTAILVLPQVSKLNVQRGCSLS